MTAKLEITQREMLQQILNREVEVLTEIRKLTRRCAKQDEQITRLIEFNRRLLSHVERIAKAAEALDMVRMKQLRHQGPFNDRRGDR